MSGCWSETPARRATNAGALSTWPACPRATKPPELKPASRLSPTTTRRRMRGSPAYAAVAPSATRQLRVSQLKFFFVMQPSLSATVSPDVLEQVQDTGRRAATGTSHGVARDVLKNLPATAQVLAAWAC